MRHTLLIRHVCPNICTDITNAQPYTVATHTPASPPLSPLATALQSCCDRKHAVYPKDTFAAHQISVLTNWPEYLPNTFGMPRELTHKVGLTHTHTHIRTHGAHLQGEGGGEGACLVELLLQFMSASANVAQPKGKQIQILFEL